MSQLQLVCITHSAQKSLTEESCFLLVFDSKLLAELNWHNQPGPPGYDNDNSVYSRLQWRRNSHLHGYFLCLVIEASLQETKGIQSFQIAEGTNTRAQKKNLLLQNTGLKELLLTYSIYLGWWKADTGFVNNTPRTITVTAKGHKWERFEVTPNCFLKKSL